MAPRPWSDLPPELVSPIADRLGLIELLRFRSVCKDWFSASSTASAEIESSPDHAPWFLLYNEDWHCLLYNTEQAKKYSLEIPELVGAICIASNHGWLLLFREDSVFFFCPFSRARIDLPQFPCSDLSDHVASFSSPPTSKDCIVAVARSNRLKFELNLLYRGDSKWKQYDDPRGRINTITGAAYHGGMFHFFDNGVGLFQFSVKEKSGRRYTVVDNTPENSEVEVLPFYIDRRYFVDKDLVKELGVEEAVSVSTCGTLVRRRLVFNENIEGTKDCEGHCLEGTCCLKGVWLQPRFFQIPPNQSWSL